MNIELEEAKKAIKELRDSYELHLRGWAERCLNTLQTELERLQEENEELKSEKRTRIIGKYGEMEIHEVINKTLQEDYIPKDKIRETIEECIKNIEEDERHDEWGYEHCKIQVLNELLEGK